MDIKQLAMAFLAAAAVGGVAWVFIYPLLSGERKAEKRRETIAKPETNTPRRETRGVGKSRRDQVEETLKAIEQRSKEAQKLTLNARIMMAGLSWSKSKFAVISVILGLIAAIGVLIVSKNFLAAIALGLAGGAGLPRWMLNFLRARREKNFLMALPDAVDVIVRGIKAGLPLFESIKVVAADAPEPLKSEFMSIIETQAIGMPLGDACLRLYERIPVPEANFFGIVIAIQQKTGGNLSEALGNLSRVLRDRKKMRGKIQAMSMEAKASAAIIGSLPLIVMLLVYLTSPTYIELLWTDPKG